MNAQEVFDKVVTHLYTQGVQSVGADGMCLYRGPNGTMCAVGALISDEDYDESFEGEAVGGILDSASQKNLPSINALKIHETLLSDLQAAHDTTENWIVRTKRPKVRLKAQLKQVANYYNLNSSVLENY